MSARSNVGANVARRVGRGGEVRRDWIELDDIPVAAGLARRLLRVARMRLQLLLAYCLDRLICERAVLIDGFCVLHATQDKRCQSILRKRHRLPMIDHILLVLIAAARAQGSRAGRFNAQDTKAYAPHQPQLPRSNRNLVHVKDGPLELRTSSGVVRTGKESLVSAAIQRSLSSSIQRIVGDHQSKRVS